MHQLARFVSIIGHPFVVLPASWAAVSLLRGGDASAARSLVLLFLVISAGVAVGIRAGRFNDFDVSERERRPLFYVWVIGAALALGLWRREVPGAVASTLIAAALLVACGLLNRRTKASLHTAFALYAAGVWGGWSLGAGLAALPFAACVGWSRARLGRHAWGEVALGAGLGLAAAVCLCGVGRT